MSNSYFVRKIDELGRIVLPIEIRKILELKEKDPLEISLIDNGIFLKKKQDSCVFCLSNNALIEYKNKHICKNCFSKLKNTL